MCVDFLPVYFLHTYYNPPYLVLVPIPMDTCLIYPQTHTQLGFALGKTLGNVVTSLTIWQET